MPSANAFAFAPFGPIDLTNELDEQIYVSDTEDEEEYEYITIEDDEDATIAASAATFPPVSSPAPLEEFEIPEVTWRDSIIRADDVVELLDHSEHEENGLFLLIDVNVHDDRPTWVQGLEEVPIDQIVRKRDCTFTSAAYQAPGLYGANPFSAWLDGDADDPQWFFDEGKLTCRWVHIREREGKGNPTAGEVRRIYKREVAEFSSKHPSATSPPRTMTASSTTPSAPSTPSTKHKRSRSIEVVEQPTKRRQQLPVKASPYRFGDVFCGIGGTSQGAAAAGWQVAFGVENEPNAMQAYRQNFPGASHYEMDAHDFPLIVKRCEHGVDLTHFSCPCQYWSLLHTISGRNDQKNMETIFVPDAVLEKTKSRLFSMEQAPGLILKKQHRLHFRALLRRLLSKNYNIRYRVQNQGWFRLPQQRARLIIIGAKIGVPLPPFPKPVCGPEGSGLERYKTVKDALRTLRGQEPRLMNHEYHQPHSEKRLNAEPVDPDTIRAKCITTSGGDNVHYSGKRIYTPLELGQLQGLPLSFHFFGSKTEARRQGGNCWSPKPGEFYYRTWAATLEAFDNDLIDAEDDIDDLYEFLEKKGVDFGKPPPIDVDDPFGRFFPQNSARPKYRYISQLEKTVKPKIPLVLWEREKNVQPRAERVRKAAASSGTAFDGADENRRSRTLSVRPRSRAATAIDVNDEDYEEEITFLGSRRR
ncbi:hypothetical protein OPT61_g10099 [Boeremia exigua]|uniref:Uncharacterized protein n=1 Tax=Boeremia exigua TaxID=749465 RepID=A0ACC2HR54_9PLEO|nr:hypothetical protein OPT61_g10099 [Boeremia exigua]